MHKLTGVPRAYDWGSTSHIQELLGDSPDGAPLAELWFGAHPTGPSVLESEGEHDTLDQLISANPQHALGGTVAAEFGELPFLMKLLAPGQPVSLQVHPTPENARTGFAREQAQSIPLSAGNRSFKDANHKPEMVFAVSEFEGLVGFRTISEVIELLGHYELPFMRAIHGALQADAGSDGLRNCLESLVRLDEASVNAAVTEARRLSPVTGLAPHATVVSLAEFYPGDSGAVASLMLNRVAFRPGDAVFVSSGMPHAYLSGLAVEVMANSDNVFRAGLTAKYVDIEGLLQNIDVSSGPVSLMDAGTPLPGVRVLRPAAREFQLTSVVVDDSFTGLDLAGPRIGICIAGKVQVRALDSDQRCELSPGEAIFAAGAEGDLEVSGAGHIVFGSTP